MSDSPYAQLYSRFLNQNKGVTHFACHSHHYWPDVTREATTRYWDDSATYTDGKWDVIFRERVPETQSLIKEILNFKDNSQCVFASNTHELVFRLLTSLPSVKKKKVLTTDSEFYSWDRQIWRLAEDHEQWEVIIVPTEPFSTFTERFIASLNQTTYDFVLLSHVFFNSGVVCPGIDQIISLIEPQKTICVVDGYHGFMAVPTTLEKWQDRAFYVAGSYKYAQGGEGCCFMITPTETQLRPQFTGWFANFFELSAKKDKTVNYGKNGERFWGSTMDFTGLYRLQSVLDLFKKQKIDVNLIHEYVQARQKEFLNILDQVKHVNLNRESLIQIDDKHHGHFLTFKLPSVDETLALRKKLHEIGVATDSRNDRLRFGFAIYHQKNYPGLTEKLKSI